MLDLLRILEYRRTLRRTRRQWRDIKVLLLLALACILFNAIGLICGATGYTLQRLGLLPTLTPLP